MVDDNNTFLLKPEGVKDFLPAETSAKRQAEDRILQILKSWGYQEVITPTLEYGNIFSADFKAGLEKRMYRFFDGWGGTLVLRPDWTLPLARLVANHLWEESLPLRLGYAGNIFRFETPQSGKQREIFQAGGELLGAAGTEADSEIIALAVEALSGVGINNVKICIGHTGFLSSLLENPAVSRAAREKITYFLIKRDFASLYSFADKLPLDDKSKTSLISLPELRGGQEVIDRAAAFMAPGKRDDFSREMYTLWDNLQQRDVNSFISFDFSILRDLNYYTGIIFEIYSPFSGYPLGGGGRYDRLLQLFKGHLPAVGFALSIDQVLAAWQQKELIQKPTLDYFIGYEKPFFAQALSKARQLRGKGFVAALDVENLPVTQAEEKALTLRAKSLIFFQEKGMLEKKLGQKVSPGRRFDVNG